MIKNYTGVPGAQATKNCAALFEAGKSENLPYCLRQQWLKIILVCPGHRRLKIALPCLRQASLKIYRIA
ncbi:hypothetical protein [Xenorhabdus bovienii]|nr:hypothetical protein [Xenorhabdus bovienii]MDE9483777.1 hypothetical protein [Xenorhabdus bovienii]